MKLFVSKFPVCVSGVDSVNGSTLTMSDDIEVLPAGTVFKVQFVSQYGFVMLAGKGRWAATLNADAVALAFTEQDMADFVE